MSLGDSNSSAFAAFYIFKVALCKTRSTLGITQGNNKAVSGHVLCLCVSMCCFRFQWGVED